MKKLVLIIAVISLAITACKKEFEPIANDNEQQIENKMLVDAVIKAGFNWKTTKDVEIQLKGSVNDVVKVKSSKGDNYLKAFLTSGDTYKTKITVPTYENEVTLAYAGTNFQVPIVNNEINYNFN